MNPTEIERIAAATNQLRPDWPVSSLRTLLEMPQLVNRPRRDVAVAITWVACEAATKTPARVLEAGPWWKATNTEPGEESLRRPPTKAEECATHPGEYAPPNCRCCWADRKAQRTAAEEQVKAAAYESRAAAIDGIRAQLAVVKGGLCSHRVPVQNCVQHRTPTESSTESEETS